MKLRWPILAALLALLSLTACSGGPQPVAAPPGAAAPETATPTAAPQDDGGAAAVKQADALMVAGKYAEGINQLYETLGKYPDNAPAWELLTFGYNQLERYDPAMVAGLRAVALASTSPAAQFNAGLALAFSGSDRAAKHLEAAASANPQPYTFYLLGSAYATAGRPQDALAAFDRGLQKFSDSADLKRGKAVATSDINMDGKPDRVVVTTNTVVIKSGTNGSELLNWSANQSGNLQASVIDIGGPGPTVLINAPPLSAAVFSWDGTSPAARGTLGGNVYYVPSTRELKVNVVDREKGQATDQSLRMKDGKLTSVRTTVTSLKAAEPPPTNLFELNAALTGHNLALAFVGYNGQPLFDKLKTLPAEAVRGIIILPEPGGKYRLELHADGVLRATATATVATDNQAFLIKELTWR
ncbi:MAG TPA: hypothetical protein VNT01_02030 [Symbiobacteriaceae bacterium]|nr:hypothetical protein [Symbiobacteriaceae bacterium]